MIEVLSGNNERAIHDRLREIIAEFEKEHAGSIERFDGAELESADTVIDAVRSISFLDPKKLVIVRDFAQSRDLLDNTEQIVEQTADSTDLVILGNFDKRSSTYKYLKSEVKFVEYKELSTSELTNWINEYTKSFNGKISNQAATYLIEQVGANQYRLKNELDKLMLCEREIDRDLIDELVEPVPQSKIFAMLDALFSGRGEQAWRIYKDQRAQGEEPQKILSMIVWQLQQLSLAVFTPVKSKKVLIDAGVSPYTAQKSLNMASNISPANLRYFIDNLAKIDYQSKTSADIESALAVYISDVASKTAI